MQGRGRRGGPGEQLLSAGFLSRSEGTYGALGISTGNISTAKGHPFLCELHNSNKQPLQAN